MAKVLRQPTHIVLLTSLCCLILVAVPRICWGQGPEPQREQLLNGLRVLLVTRPGDQNVLLKLRIHSGATFDMAGKAGTMALLGEMLFPDATTYDYFKEEMNGRLVVETDRDAINITLQGRAAEYDRIVDILRAALVTTQLTPEVVTKIRDAKIKVLSEVKSSAADTADRVIAERLFGSFPYANAPAGTVESLSRIDRADLMLARERFLSPNNSTLVIIGGVDQRRAMRALRQLLGGWRKSDQLVPATFRQPAQPDARTVVANFPGAQTTEVRLATRGLARGDRDYFAAALLGAIARDRWQKQLPDVKGNFFVRHEAHLLPGMFVMGAAVDNTAAKKTLEAARMVLKSLVDSPVLPIEIEKAKSDVLATMDAKLPPDDKLANDWLNIEAYTLPSISEQMRTLNSLSAADLQRVSLRLFRELPIASVVVGNAQDLKAQLTPDIAIEILGEPKAKAPEQSSTTTPVKPPKRRTFPGLTSPKSPNPLLKNTRPATKPD